MMGFWEAQLSAGQAPAQQPQSLAQHHREWMRRTSASAQYAEPAGPAQRPSIYVQAEPKTYSSNVNDKLARRAGESAEAWRRPVNNVIQHLPADQRLALESAIEAARTAEAPQDHAGLRQQLDARVEGTGYGIAGAAYDRTAVHGRWGGRTIEAHGQVASSVETIAQVPGLSSNVAAYAIARQREAEARGEIPQRTVAPTSSGTGIFVTPG
jgi:hypothetical protein